MKLHFLQKLVPPLIETWMHLIGKTMKLQFDSVEAYPTRDMLEKYNNAKTLFAIYHSRLVYLIYFGRNWNVTAMISKSRDGDMIADTASRLRLYAMRGSSSKNGKLAMNQVVDVLNNNYKVAITIDGPRGPVGQVKPGVIRIAQLSGAPIIPVGFSCTKGMFFPSWDRFLVPYPNSKGNFRCGEPLFIPPNISEEEFESYRLQLENTLKELNKKSDEICQRNPEKEVCNFFKKKKNKKK